ncbi:hypothetical protein KR222_002301 [Zaprionus bogoriensis]|nr:hypothetical protein KR222_002301 [Zaprionus bogoriensis]
MLLLSLIERVLHQPRDQLSLLRALASGGRIPGTNLVLLSAATLGGANRFEFIDHLMMALAGGWLLLRVLFSELDEEKDEPIKQKGQDREYSESTYRTESTTTSQVEYGDIELAIEKYTRHQWEEEELIYWGCEKDDGNEPMLRFSRTQLDVLLRLEEEADEDEEEEELQLQLELNQTQQQNEQPKSQPQPPQQQQEQQLQLQQKLEQDVLAYTRHPLTISRQYKGFHPDENIIFAH